MGKSLPDDFPIPYEEVKTPCRTNYGYPKPSGTGTSQSFNMATVLLSLALLMGILAL